MGLDKFFNLLTQWPKFVCPLIANRHKRGAASMAGGAPLRNLNEDAGLSESGPRGW
jgi:hypothetical protein